MKKKAALDQELVIIGSPNDVELRYGLWFIFHQTNFMHSFCF